MKVIQHCMKPMLMVVSIPGLFSKLATGDGGKRKMQVQSLSICLMKSDGRLLRHGISSHKNCHFGDVNNITGAVIQQKQKQVEKLSNYNPDRRNPNELCKSDDSPN